MHSFFLEGMNFFFFKAWFLDVGYKPKNKPWIFLHGWFLEMSPKHQSVSGEIKGFPFQKNWFQKLFSKQEHGEDKVTVSYFCHSLIPGTVRGYNSLNLNSVNWRTLRAAENLLADNRLLRSSARNQWSTYVLWIKPDVSMPSLGVFTNLSVNCSPYSHHCIVLT